MIRSACCQAHLSSGDNGRYCRVCYSPCPSADDVTEPVLADGRYEFRPNATCVECGRTFDLTIPSDAEEWAYGHDCET